MAKDQIKNVADVEEPIPDKNNKAEKKSSLKAVEKPEEGTVVSFSDKIWIEGTGESKHLKKGKKAQVQRLHGEHLVKKGAAKEIPAPQPKSKPPAKKQTTDDDDDE